MFSDGKWQMLISLAPRSFARIFCPFCIWNRLKLLPEFLLIISVWYGLETNSKTGVYGDPVTTCQLTRLWKWFLGSFAPEIPYFMANCHLCSIFPSICTCLSLCTWISGNDNSGLCRVYLIFNKVFSSVPMGTC